MISIAAAAFRKARTSVLTAANSAGVNRLLADSRWRSNHLLILCYHGVSIDDEHEWSDLYISPDLLERRLSLLRRSGANVLPLTEALELLARGELPRQAVALTFDDGAHDFAVQAAPILSAAKAPSTVYLTTYYSGRDQPVFDTVTSYMLWKARGQTVRIPGFKESTTIPMHISDAEFGDIHLRLRRQALENGLNADAKNEWARSLAAVVGVDFDRILELKLFQIMSPEEVGALDTRLVDVQLHTHRHRTPRDHELFMREIRDNSVAIRAAHPDGATLNHFCYPSGDHVPEYATWLREAGVRWATTCDPGLATKADDPLFLPRIADTQSISDATFMAWVSGLGMFTYLRRSESSPRL